MRACSPNFARSAAAWCLSRIGGPEACQRLVSAFGDVDRNLREETLEGVVTLDSDAVPILLSGLQAVDPAIPPTAVSLPSLISGAYTIGHQTTLPWRSSAARMTACCTGESPIAAQDRAPHPMLMPCLVLCPQLPGRSSLETPIQLVGRGYRLAGQRDLTKDRVPGGVPSRLSWNLRNGRTSLLSTRSTHASGHSKRDESEQRSHTTHQRGFVAPSPARPAKANGAARQATMHAAVTMALAKQRVALWSHAIRRLPRCPEPASDRSGQTHIRGSADPSKQPFAGRSSDPQPHRIRPAPTRTSIPRPPAACNSPPSAAGARSVRYDANDRPKVREER